MVICCLAEKEKTIPEKQKEGIFPDKCLKLGKFFDDLKGNFGSFDLFETVKNFSLIIIFQQTKETI